MKLRVVVIDEPIHITNEAACDLWRKALWAKELGYRNEYKNSMLPMSTDDFFGTHLIVADEKSSGKLEPVAMYKAVRLSQTKRFRVPFGGMALLKGSKYENSIALEKVLHEPGDISYDSSWSINPTYKKDKEFSQLLRDYITLFCCNLHNSLGYHRWITAGVTRFKIDQYFAWLGGQELLPEFELPIIDNETVRMFYVPDTRALPSQPLAVAFSLQSAWDNRVIFAPTQEIVRQLEIAA